MAITTLLYIVAIIGASCVSGRCCGEACGGLLRLATNNSNRWIAKVSPWDVALDVVQAIGSVYALLALLGRGPL